VEEIRRKFRSAREGLSRLFKGREPGARGRDLRSKAGVSWGEFAQKSFNSCPYSKAEKEGRVGEGRDGAGTKV